MKILIILSLLFSLVCCSTKNNQILSTQVEQKIEQPINKIIKDSEPSFDNNEQNSGIIDFVSGKGWIITSNAAKRYNILIERYGKELMPPIERDFGLSQDGNFFVLTQQGMVNFALLNQKYKSQIK